MITVALPLWKAEKIGWLALEGLCNQENAPCDWELIIAEEQCPESMGEARISRYESRLHKAGCTRIEYISLRNWIPLAKKYYIISKEASPGTIAFLIQSADSYSSKNRLSETYREFRDDKAEWIHLMEGFGYLLKHNLWRKYKKNPARHLTSSFAAIRGDLIKKLPKANHAKRNVDHWLYRHTVNHNSNVRIMNPAKQRDGFTTNGIYPMTKSIENRMLMCRQYWSATTYKGESIPPRIKKKLRGIE